MIKKSVTLYMNMLPLVILIALILGAGYFLIAGDGKIPFFKNNNKLEIKRLANFPATIETSEVFDKIRVVIKSQEELTEFFKSRDKNSTLSLPENVNFNEEFLIAVSSKTFTETGHALKIKKIYKEKEENALLVLVEQTDPDEACMTEATQLKSNVIIDLISIKKTDKAFDFEVVKKNDEECKIQ